jgi:Protein of unknown function (DUF3225)/Protein of unknown function (DUF4089)
MQINDPAVIAELTRCHEVYEKALIDNDVATLDGFFWDSPHAIRFGVAENLHGTNEIRAFRKGRPNINLARDILRLDIMAIGDAAGVVNLEFLRPMNGIERYGRQTQFWFKFPEGWRIASAHVSLMPLKPLPEQAAYLQAASGEIGLPIDTGQFAAVGDDLSRIAAIAQFLMQFPLSQSVEAAPVFQP